MMDWIKIEINLPNKPEVCQIAAASGLDVDTVTGKLVRLWGWASMNCTDRGVTSVTVEPLLNRITGVENFVQFLVDCGWIRRKNEALIFVNFDRHNSKTAKTRAQNTKRINDYRAKFATGKCNGESVTKALPEKEKEIEKEVVTETPYPFESDTFQKAWADYLTYRRESRMKALPPSTVRARFHQFQAWGEVVAIEAIRLAIANGWAGIFEPKDSAPGSARAPQRSPSNAAHGSDPHKYDHLIVRSEPHD